MPSPKTELLVALQSQQGRANTLNLQNAANVTEVVREIVGTLDALGDALDRHDRDAVEAFFARGVSGRVELERRTGVATVLELPADDAEARAALLALGHRGGYITRIEERATGAVTIRARIPTSRDGAA